MLLTCLAAPLTAPTDSGSADLWIISDQCQGKCSSAVPRVPLYSQHALAPAGRAVRLFYGDSHTGTHAYGPIGTDTVRLGGLAAPGQYLAAITDTNTSVLDAGSAGILGLGFPPISIIWRELVAADVAGSKLPGFGRADAGGSDYGARAFPSLGFLSGAAPAGPHKRGPEPSPPPSAADSFATFGPLLARLVTLEMLSRPLVVAALQRDTLSLGGGHAGTLSLGAMPPGLSEDDLTWVPVRGYKASEGGLPPPPQAPDEVYPLVWEVPIDDVYFDGAKLPRSTLSPPSLPLSALIDTVRPVIVPVSVLNSLPPPL